MIMEHKYSKAECGVLYITMYGVVYKTPKNGLLIAASSSETADRRIA